MNNKYKVDKLSETQRLNKIDTVIKIYRNDKKMIDEDDIKLLVDNLKKANIKKGNKAQYMIRARNIHKMTTLKGFENNGLIDYEDEYYIDMDKNKFTQYYYIEVTIRK